MDDATLAERCESPIVHLDDHDIHLFRTYVAVRSQAPHADWHVLSNDERERANRLILPQRRADFVSMRAWLRRILAHYLQLSASAVAFTYNPHGRPELARSMDLSFNLSHSERWALLALRRSGALGVDLEHCRSGRSWQAIADRFFAEPESAWMATANRDRLPEDVFYTIWARKEAYLKALGTGLSLSPQSFAWDHEAMPMRLLFTDPAWHRSMSWQLIDISGWADYRAALCYEGQVKRLCAFEIKRAELEGMS